MTSFHSLITLRTYTEWRDDSPSRWIFQSDSLDDAISNLASQLDLDSKEDHTKNKKIREKYMVSIDLGIGEFSFSKTFILPSSSFCKSFGLFIQVEDSQ